MPDKPERKREWPETLEATRRAMQASSGSSWDLVDTLVREVADKDCRTQTWTDMARYLEANGVESTSTGKPYTPATLRDYRERMGREFPPDKRVPGASFSAHSSAGNPERLRQALAHLGTSKATTEQVRLALSELTSIEVEVPDSIAKRIDDQKRARRMENAFRTALGEAKAIADEGPVPKLTADRLERWLAELGEIVGKVKGETR